MPVGTDCFLARLYDPARQSLACVAGRLSAIVVGVLVDHDGSSDDICRSELIGKKAHARVPVTRYEHGEITDMISMRLIGWIPVFPGGLEGLLWIPDRTYSFFVKVEAKRADGLLISSGRFVGRQPADFHIHFCAIGDIFKQDIPVDVGCQRAALNYGVRP